MPSTAVSAMESKPPFCSRKLTGTRFGNFPVLGTFSTRRNNSAGPFATSLPGGGEHVLEQLRKIRRIQRRLSHGRSGLKLLQKIHAEKLFLLFERALRGARSGGLGAGRIRQTVIAEHDQEILGTGLHEPE